ncbi:hypothetical protein WICPIJ_007073 [Wickerhamomyces pijperi]|uniref:Uncharacterized protein n=1 Tax=Wickerhamomyces pijperi TaxID=599730 RepID=A0A9P8Q330_WICPI|nr:hypothetical protein WICPIJ_007073 [Wickerhamomyces pijperi]
MNSAPLAFMLRTDSMMFGVATAMCWTPGPSHLDHVVGRGHHHGSQSRKLRGDVVLIHRPELVEAKDLRVNVAALVHHVPVLVLDTVVNHVQLDRRQQRKSRAVHLIGEPVVLHRTVIGQVHALVVLHFNQSVEDILKHLDRGLLDGPELIAEDSWLTDSLSTGPDCMLEHQINVRHLEGDVLDTVAVLLDEVVHLFQDPTTLLLH